MMPSVLPYTGGSVKLGVAGVHFIDRISVRFQVCGDSSKEFIVPGQFLPSQNDSCKAGCMHACTYICFSVNVYVCMHAYLYAVWRC